MHPAVMAISLGKSSKEDKNVPADEEDDSLELSEKFLQAAKDVKALANMKGSDEDFAVALKNAIHECLDSGGY